MMNILILLFSIIANAGITELKIQSKNFEEAEKAKNHFKFIGHSRKLGIIGTSFEGYAKEALLSFEKKENRFENVTLTIVVSSLDTDNNSRNEKMMETCLNAKEFPEILIKLKDPILVEKDSQEVGAEMTVRGTSLPLKIKINKNKEDAFSGSTSFRLSDAKIPDPSILVASVRDEFEIEFQISPVEAP